MKNLFFEALLLCRFKFKLTQYLLLLLLLISNSIASQNIALNKPVWVSSEEAPGTNAKHFVNDGDYNTYWSSDYNDNEWIYIDLLQKYNLGEIKIYWEDAYAKQYKIETSGNAKEWLSVYFKNTNGGNDVLPLQNRSARYVRIYSLERATEYGIAIHEIEIFGEVFNDYYRSEKRTTDGISYDQDGNTFEWINYGNQNWSIENAKVTTYRDGTPIPQVTNSNEWRNLTTGAWCYTTGTYVNEDTIDTKLYNWYAIMGIHDNDPNTPNKEFAPNGWKVPSIDDWKIMTDYLQDSGYRADFSYPSTYNYNSWNFLARALSSSDYWRNSYEYYGLQTFFLPGSGSNSGVPKNLTGFNAIPIIYRSKEFGQYNPGGDVGVRYHLTDLNQHQEGYSMTIHIQNNWPHVPVDGFEIGGAIPVRFVSDDSTASINDYNNIITIYPNPTTSIVTIEGDAIYDIEVYSLQGIKVMTHKGNSIDLSALSNAMYIIKATNTANKQQQIYKVIKE
jgi:uncharacterized protein (TIGR02145 family)